MKVIAKLIGIVCLGLSLGLMLTAGNPASAADGDSQAASRETFVLRTVRVHTDFLELKPLPQETNRVVRLKVSEAGDPDRSIRFEVPLVRVVDWTPIYTHGLPDEPVGAWATLEVRIDTRRCPRVLRNFATGRVIELVGYASHMDTMGHSSPSGSR